MPIHMLNVHTPRLTGLALVSLVLVACAAPAEDPPEVTVTASNDESTTSDSESTSSVEGDVPGPIDYRCPGSELIDDLEDGDGLLFPYLEEPREGAWYTYNDESGGVQEPEAGGTFLPSADGANGTLNGANTKGSGFTVWGAGLGFDLNNPGCEKGEKCPIGNEHRELYNATAWKGFRFWIKANTPAEVIPGPIDVKLTSELETPDTEGGTCVNPEGESTCSDSYLKRITPSAEWQVVEVLFTDLAQGGWGQAFDLDLTKVYGIQWQVGKGETFDFTVDEVCFITAD